MEGIEPPKANLKSSLTLASVVAHYQALANQNYLVMSDKYGTGKDPYCYSSTNVLINLLDIRDAQILEDAERDITVIRADEVEFIPPPYSFDQLCRLHKTLFGDLYPWAGDIRKIDISKGNTRFCNLTRIDAEIAKLFTQLSKPSVNSYIIRRIL